MRESFSEKIFKLFEFFKLFKLFKTEEFFEFFKLFGFEEIKRDGLKWSNNYRPGWCKKNASRTYGLCC